MRQEAFMRSFKLWGAMCGAALLAVGAWAQPPEVSTTKIAFVYVQKALASTEEGKARLKELDDWARPRQEQLAKLDKEVNDLKNEIMSKQGTVSDDALAELNRQLVAKHREFEDKQRDGKRDFDQKQQSLLRDLGGKLQQVITDYSAQNHYTAVFIFKPDDLAYLDPGADITDTIIKLYNQKYPLAAKPASSAPAK
jgi:Skp family chaperone for outer membrane proteins